jgi:uncharacterized membrane protein YhaH (DUF805 family)
MRRTTGGVLARVVTAFDPRGRSTRTDLLGFGFMLGFIGLLIGCVSILFGIGPETEMRIGGTGGILVSLLWILLFVRRLHDTGRSAAGLLVALPAMIAGAYEERARLLHDWTAVHRPWWLQALIGASSLALLILLLWKPDEGPNRYGPNPREGAPDEEAQLA